MKTEALTLPPQSEADFQRQVIALAKLYRWRCDFGIPKYGENTRENKGFEELNVAAVRLNSAGRTSVDALAGPDHAHPLNKRGHVMAEANGIRFCDHCEGPIAPTGRGGRYRKSQRFCGRKCARAVQPIVYRPMAERFDKWVRVEPDGCWRWTGNLTTHGYGRLRYPGAGGILIHAHVYAYQRKYGLVPEGKELDHLCRNRWCCNPDHVEAVTHRENAIRGEAPMVKLHRAGVCLRGHAVCEENTRFYTNGTRTGRVAYCKVCRRSRSLSSNDK